jgi:3',5'-cyclic AMP phosphodiesterase CpdA
VAQVRTSEAIVAFLTETALVAEVEYGPTPAYGASVADAMPVVEHVFTLAGLTPGEPCLYRIRIGGEVISEGHAFRAAPAAPDAPLRFVTLGDSGNGSQAQADVAAFFGALAPDLVLHTGDAVYEFGAPSELDRGYFLPYRDLIDDIPFYVALGNHDTYWDGGRSLLGSLYLPVNDADFTERFYSFDVGEAHFVALDTNGDIAPPSVQLDWLAADLAAHADARWRFVFFHHPPYSSGRPEFDPDLRASLVPLLEQYGVDLVFSGHDHIYHRSYPMTDDTVVDAAEDPDYVDPGGPVYIVSGGGGKSLHSSAPQPFTAFTEVTFHFVVVDVSGPSLTLRGIRQDGTEMDRMTITKVP